MNILKNFILKPTCLKIYSQAKRCASSNLYEPDYLEVLYNKNFNISCPLALLGLKPKTPLYDTLNIELTGYDYPVLESYQKFLHNILKNMDISVEECWSLPAQNMQISTYKTNSEIINSKYNLKIYNRIVQITDVQVTQLPAILRAVEASLPAGVTLNVRQHQDSDEEARYIPDSELNTLKQQLDELGGPSKSKK